ncbi:MAG: hypothetical protein KDC44_09480 [Phaeodactylibacter sp.]|nr:hypothetical protein [Phaeodactylibacter sp.]
MSFRMLLPFLLLGCLSATAAKAQEAALFKTNMPKPGATETDRVAMGIKKIKKGGVLQVTDPYYDDIGQILEEMDFDYLNYNPKKEAEILFLNCGTATRVEVGHLRRFVENGGVLYASDLASSLLVAAFPGAFEFAGNTGSRGHVVAFVEDPDLRAVMGPATELHFDMNGWTELLDVTNGEVLMRSERSGLPLMVKVAIGEGTVFYTCFHNHAQASEKEQAIMQLLVAKQVAEVVQTPFHETARHMGLDLVKLKSTFEQ